MVTHDSLGPLGRYLPAQVAAAERLGSELVAVDNASRDGSLELLRDIAERSAAMRLVANRDNLGYAAGVNAAFAAAPGRDVMLINPDVALDRPEPVAALAAVLAAAPRAGVVAPALEGPDGTRQESARRYPTLAAMLASGRAGSDAATRPYRDYVAPSGAAAKQVVDWVIGAAMLIRRRAWEAVGGWDERFFLYMEDADFCRRCTRAGWDVIFAPEIALRHDYARASSTGGGVLANRARRRHVAGLARFWAREPRLLMGQGRLDLATEPSAPRERR